MITALLLITVVGLWGAYVISDWRYLRDGERELARPAPRRQRTRRPGDPPRCARGYDLPSHERDDFTCDRVLQEGESTYCTEHKIEYLSKRVYAIRSWRGLWPTPQPVPAPPRPKLAQRLVTAPGQAVRARRERLARQVRRLADRVAPTT